MHSYAPFLVDRAYEQIKLDLGHQDVGAVLVSIGASYDAAGGATPTSRRATSRCWTRWTAGPCTCPATPTRCPPLLRAAAGTRRSGVRAAVLEGEQRGAHGTGPKLQVIRRGRAGAPVVVAVGPMLDPVLAAVAGPGRDRGVHRTPRGRSTPPGLRALVDRDVVLVEPYLAGTSGRLVAEALSDLPHRALHLGVGRIEMRHYGSPKDHARAHGLDPAGLRRSIVTFLG